MSTRIPCARTVWFLALTLLVAAGSRRVPARTPSTHGVPAARSATPQQQAPTFRSGVDVVAIDVNVVDARAKPIEGLRPEDFSVTVDRKPRRIVSAQFINHGVRPPSPARGRSGTGASVLDALSAPAPTAPGRNVMIVVDTDSLDVGDGRAATLAARAFLDLLPPSDRVGVATIPRLPSSLTFVADRTQARKALDAVIAGNLDLPSPDFAIGLHEAYEIERADSGVISSAVARECKCAYTPDAVANSSGAIGTGTGDAAASGTTSGCTSAQIQNCVVPFLMQAHQVALAGHMQAQRSLDALRDLADGLRQVQGPKTVIFVSGGLGIPETNTSFDPLEPALANGQVTLYTLYIEQMSLGQSRRAPSPTFAFDDRIASYGIENVTGAAGGTLVRVIGRIDSAFERIAGEMSGSYLLGIEVEPADRDGRPHDVQVKVNRAGLEVRSRRRYVIEPEKPGTRLADEPVSAPLSEAARAARRAERAAMVPELEAVTPELVELLARAGSFAVDYGTQVPALLCDEQYDQTLSKWKSGPTVVNGVSQNRQDWFIDKRRHMTSDYVLVRDASPTNPIGWLHFRDPFEVDGSAVRPHSARLARAFTDSPATALQQAAQIMTESARYNLGFGERNMDVPTFALMLLQPANRGRFFFRKESQLAIGSTTVWQVAFVERGTPTIFVGNRSTNLPLQGTLWIEPQQGRVVRSTMRLNMEEADAEITVTYAPGAALGGIWVPSEMRETYTSDTQKLETVARYMNVRQIGG